MNRIQSVELSSAINTYCLDPENPEKNFQLGLVYESLGQTAAALSFFLRTSERTSISELNYECLLKMALCLDKQGNRNTSVRNCLHRALTILPKRPEAYFLLSRYHEKLKEYPQGYSYAQLGLEFCDFNLSPLRSSVEYPGKYGLVFEIAVCAWWWGRRTQSRQLFKELYLKQHGEMDKIHTDSVGWNVKNLNVDIGIKNSLPTVIEKTEVWKRTQWPTMEITTNIAVKGCVVDCAFCPQRTLEKSYKSDQRILTMDNFKLAIDKLPKEIRITFAGFTEPFLNRHCADMILYAHEKGHPVAVFTTAVGMKPEDILKIKHIPFDNGPNGGFCLHLPDQERLAKHPINKNFIQTLETIRSVQSEIKGFYAMSMSKNVHESVSHLFDNVQVPDFWARAGNLLNELNLKPDMMSIKNRIKSVDHGNKDKTCGQPEDLYHNVLLPNGDVSLCCQDYSLEHILGNLFTQDYIQVIPKPQSCYLLCRKCENGIDPYE